MRLHWRNDRRQVECLCSRRVRWSPFLTPHADFTEPRDEVIGIECVRVGGGCAHLEPRPGYS